MKLWFRLTLVGGVLVCLFFSLTQAVGLNHPLQVVGSGPWLDPGREPASDAPTVSVGRSMELPARAEPFESQLVDYALTANHLGPPGAAVPWTTAADGALASCRSSRQLNQRPRANLLRKITAQ
jgi:hypothetical protein